MKTKFLLFALVISAFTSLSWAAAPAVPTAIVITPGNNSLSVAFTAPAVPSPVISNYEYSTDGGLNWRTRTDAGTTASPISITTISAAANTALVNGTSYNVQIRANNGTAGTATASVASTPLWGDGTSNSPYKISTAVQWSALRATIASSPAGWPYVELSNDVTLSSINAFNITLSGFKGVFDGKGFKLTLAIGTTTNRYAINSLSFFNISGAIIKNLETNVTLYGGITSNAAYTTGSGLVGTADGTNNTIQNCKVTGVVDMANTGTTNKPGAIRVGGIVGTCNVTGAVTIINCTSSINLKATTTVTVSASPGTLQTPYCGGIVGAIAAGAKVYIINSSAAGSVFASSNELAPYAGGISAQGGAATADFQIINCLATNTVEGRNTSATATTGCFVGGVVGNLTQDDAAAIVKNNIALNPSLKSITYSTTVPTLYRISPKTDKAVFTDNYAKNDMTLTANISSTDGINGTAQIITVANIATDGNGADLNTSDPIGDAASKLNTYVSMNTTYNSIVLTNWPAGLGTSVKSQPELKSLKYNIANGVLNVNGIEGSTQLSIYSVSGAVCKQLTVSNSYNTSLAKGIYILKVEGFKASKLVVY